MLRRKALLKRLRTTTTSKTGASLERVAASTTVDRPILGGTTASRIGKAVIEPRYAQSVGSAPGLLSTRTLQPIFVSPPTRDTYIDDAKHLAPRKRTILRRRRTSQRSTSEVRVLSRQGDIRQLRSYLQHEDVVLIAIDTESERQGLLNHVVEVGLSVLRTRDIHNVKPGAHVKNWIAKVRHHHIVIDVTRHPRRRMRGSRFGRSLFLSPGDAKDELLAIVKSSLADIGTDSIAFVGHSLGNDIQAVLQSPGLATDLLDISRPGHAVFDTFTLATAAEREGARIPKKSLSGLARCLQVDPRYCDENGAVIGWHNASNDAAYTMMVLLLYGAHWQDLKIVYGKRQS
ncbi:hypothetical protein DOTSEDRAFT_76908 [Dothistroma septosporum NZE10]|uniref:Gfd2/YDR514C-like C-terminal domain-containing protein n=1 Tax=Dothistroma septosporum (strain NZE10 / CBS 128990) TaxID=675120 RepID=N1Q1W6_DOTSN|nr:hypothetical protein DOTSEDRAFT_76908 [Dothistroma septosporum NZE10]